MNDVGRMFTPEQQEAIDTWNRAVTLLAAAGSGKTTVLVERFLKCLDHGTAIDRILVVTFTNEAADQLKDRIQSRLMARGVSAKTLESLEHHASIGTVHSFCYRLLNKYGSGVGLVPIQGILSPFDFLTSFEDSYRQWLFSLRASQLSSLLEYVSAQELKDLVRSFYEQRFFLERRVSQLNHDSISDRFLIDLWELSHPLINQLSQAFAQRGLFSFDDLEHYTLRMLDHYPDANRRVKEAFEYILVDEFQDTSHFQWEILQRLIAEDFSKLFVVGDPKQSIYRFRNADFQLFLQVANSMPEKGGTVLELSHNFRSEAKLLEAINHLSEPLFSESPIAFSSMKAGRGAEVDTASRLFVERFGGEMTKAELVKEEIRAVVSFLKRQLLSSPPEGFALLFRVSDRMPDYAEALKAEGIAVFCKKTTSLFQHYEVLDLINFLKAIRDPLDDFVFGSFLKSSPVGLTHEALWKLTEQSGSSLYEKARSQIPSLEWFYGLVEGGETNTRELMSILFAETAYWPDQWDVLLPFLAPLCEPSLTLFEALDRVETWKKEEISVQTDDGGIEEGTVRLMTVHAAKGLEFDHVLLVDMLRQAPRRSPKLLLSREEPPAIQLKQEGEVIPCEVYKRLQEKNAKEELEESRRVLYVALTRARESLTLFLPQNPKWISKGSWAFWLHEALQRNKGA